MADLKETLNELNNTADTTAEFDPADIAQNKVMGVLAYFSWLVLVPIFAAKESKFARYHANQGLALAIAEIICWVVFGILTRFPLIGWIFGIAEGLVSLVCFVIAIVGIVNAANGRAKELPIVGKLKILQ